MSKIFKFSEATKVENPGVYNMFWFMGREHGATKMMAVMYEYEPNVEIKRVHYHKNRESAYIILQGEAHVHLNGELHILGPHNVAYLSPGDIHGIVGSGPEGFKMIKVWAPMEQDIVYLEDGKVVE
ncbi:MAG: cupin domain-containing protein [Candidatus Bathyarchaeota archaeon]|nr:cupin domain-containing protein [Candidatus Bathyarchaeota archaeon]